MICFLYPQLNYSENTTQSIQINSIYTLFRMTHILINLAQINMGVVVKMTSMTIVLTTMRVRNAICVGYQ